MLRVVDEGVGAFIEVDLGDIRCDYAVYFIPDCRAGREDDGIRDTSTELIARPIYDAAKTSCRQCTQWCVPEK